MSLKYLRLSKERVKELINIESNDQEAEAYKRQVSGGNVHNSPTRLVHFIRDIMRLHDEYRPTYTIIIILDARRGSRVIL